MLNSTEAIYGFVSWLTTKDGTIKLGSKHDCSEIVNLIDEFCKTNNLPDVSENWPENLNKAKS